MLLTSKKIVEEINSEQARQVVELAQRGRAPRLAIILATNNPATLAYVGAKQKYGAAIGAKVDVHRVDGKKILPTVKKLNNDKYVDGVIIQLPLPGGVNTKRVLDSVDPGKDVDGLGEGSKFGPAATKAIEYLLDHYNIELSGKQIAVIGKGRLVGQPLYKKLSRKYKKIAAYDVHTKNLPAKTREADVVFTATGQPGLIKSNWLKKGSVIIDAGTSRAAGKLVGDASPELYKRNDIKITPVPGGVGPLTVCTLFENLLKASTR